MARDIISINSTHYVGNNLYRLKLPKAVKFKKEDKLSLYSFSMYNSFLIIWLSYRNCKFIKLIIFCAISCF